MIATDSLPTNSDRGDPGDAVHGVGVRLARAEIFVLDVTLTHTRTLSKGAVATGESSRDAVLPVLVKLTSTDGATGYGQVRPPTPWLGETTSSIVSALRHFFTPLLVGADVSQRAANARRMRQSLPGNTVALAAIDMAVHDLLGQTYGIPVYELLGGRRRPIPMDWSVSLNPKDVMIAECVRAVQDYGVTMLCLKAGMDKWAEDVDIFRAVHAAVGDHVEIGMDPNESYDVATTVRVVGALDGHVAYLEQPLHRNDRRGLVAIRGAITAPIFVDEGAISLSDTADIITAGAADALVLKLWKSGGFAGAIAMATMADAAGLRTTVGGVAHGSVLEAAACAHLYCSVDPTPLAAEFILGLNVLDEDPITELPDDFRPSDGVVQAPPRPGLGVRVDAKALSARTVTTFVIE